MEQTVEVNLLTQYHAKNTVYDAQTLVFSTFYLSDAYIDNTVLLLLPNQAREHILYCGKWLKTIKSTPHENIFNFPLFCSFYNASADYGFQYSSHTLRSGLSLWWEPAYGACSIIDTVIFDILVLVLAFFT